jgi:hypothetical protein
MRVDDGSTVEQALRGGDGTRTHDFFDATEALFQLSYTPERDDSG